MESQNQNLQSFSIVYSPIPLNAFIEAVADKIIEKQNNLPPKSTDLKDEIIRMEPLLQAMDKSRPTLNTYMKKGKIRSHYFDEGSPIFLREELLEDIKNLPGYHEVYLKILHNKKE